MSQINNLAHPKTTKVEKTHKPYEGCPELRRTLSPCGRGWLREAQPGEGVSRQWDRSERTPHPTELVSTGGAALSLKGRGHDNARLGALKRTGDGGASSDGCYEFADHGRRHSGMVRRTRPQVRNCALGNPQIPGSMLRIAPE